MEHLVEHIVTGLAVVFASLAAWFARKAGKSAQRQTLEAVVRDACDYARAHPAVGIPLERTAFEAAKRLDVQADGKQDFTDAALSVAVKAELARRKSS